jgi:hypothetical protein
MAQVMVTMHSCEFTDTAFTWGREGGQGAHNLALEGGRELEVLGQLATLQVQCTPVLGGGQGGAKACSVRYSYIVLVSHWPG